MDVRVHFSDERPRLAILASKASHCLEDLLNRWRAGELPGLSHEQVLADFFKRQERVVRGALGLKVKGLGYNPSFFYPREGGIGALPAGERQAAHHPGPDEKLFADALLGCGGGPAANAAVDNSSDE